MLQRKSTKLHALWIKYLLYVIHQITVYEFWSIFCAECSYPCLLLHIVILVAYSTYINYLIGTKLGLYPLENWYEILCSFLLKINKFRNQLKYFAVCWLNWVCHTNFLYFEKLTFPMYILDILLLIIIIEPPPPKD